MPGNRVEELEATVSELESTVSGLTEELVEAKERIRDLEAELEPDPADGSQFPEADPQDVEAAASQVDGEATPSEDPPATDTDTDRVEGGKEEPTDAEDESAESSGDDIIIA